jgi:hypothetical protein
MSDWLPVVCSTCGKTVGAAPPDRAPALTVCRTCRPGVVLAALRTPLEDEAGRELYLPLKKKRVSHA